MTFSEIAHRMLVLLAVSVGAITFAGAACEREMRADVPSTHQTAAGTSDPQDAPKATNQDAKMADDIGPKAPAVFMLSGLKGYTEPCGCTIDIMLGGIDRIVRYAKDAAKLYPASTLVDGGDLLFEYTTYDEKQIPQERARVGLISAAIKQLNPVFTVPGERDFALGAEFYEKTLRDSGVDAFGANIALNGRQLPAAKVLDLSGTRVLLVAVADPELYKNIDGIAVTDADKAIRSALTSNPSTDVQILVAHGDLAFVKARLAANPELDFGQVGHNPRETDQSDDVGNAHTLEPYDQGRYFGILKLYKAAGDPTFVNARKGSKSELESIEKQINHVRDSISRLPSEATDAESPMRVSLRQRLKNLEKKRAEFQAASIEIPTGQSTFLWRSVAMEPGLPTDRQIEQARIAYNKSLKTLNMSVDREIPAVAQGAAFYIGTDQCGLCHTAAHEVWKTTAHARAWETLVQRDKEFDQTCIGCHVVGYERPGGSVIGKVHYPATLKVSDNAPAIQWTKDLRNVGCENCHGPGSLHRLAPVDANGRPQNIIAQVDESTCVQCHVPEHSPRFDFEHYVQRITGQGHKLSQKR